MTETETTAGKSKPMFMLIVAGLTLVLGGAGFALGYSQTFVPIEGGATGLFGTGLKHQYFLHIHGSRQPPYTVAVTLNGHNTGTYSATGKIIEVTDFVVKDRNKILFEAKRLPESMFKGGAWIEVTLVQGKRSRDGGYKDGQVLLRYERKAKDSSNYRDEMDWVTVDE